MARKKAADSAQPWASDTPPVADTEQQTGETEETPAETEEETPAETTEEQAKDSAPEPPPAPAEEKPEVSAAIKPAPKKKPTDGLVGDGVKPGALKEGDHLPNEVISLMSVNGISLKEAIHLYNKKAK